MVNRYLDLAKILSTKNSAFLFGPRGVGKTWLCQKFLKTVPHSFEINFLHHEIFTRYLAHPELFRKEIEEKLITTPHLTVYVDEVQKLPHLLDEVHYLIEKYKNKINFILTGSSARKLKRKGANLLAGRAWTLHLHPLSCLELNIDQAKALKFGTLPAIYLHAGDQERTLKAYVETYLKEEIMQEALVRNIEGYIKFIDLAAQMNGEPINFSKIAAGCGVSTKTAQEFFAILTDTLIAFKINGWSRSIRKQIQQSPKYYFFDCGVLNAVRGELKTELKKSSYYYGKLFETYVIQEIIHANDYTESGYELHYWRTNTGMEVDIILSRGISELPIAIEIKSQTAPGKKDLHGLTSFKSENEKAVLYCFCNTPRSYSLGKIKIMPWQEGIEKIFSVQIADPNH